LERDRAAWILEWYFGVVVEVRMSSIWTDSARFGRGKHPWRVEGLKGGNTLSNSRELVIVAVDVTLPDASADIPHLAQHPFCLPLSA